MFAGTKTVNTVKNINILYIIILLQKVEILTMFGLHIELSIAALILKIYFVVRSWQDFAVLLHLLPSKA